MRERYFIIERELPEGLSKQYQIFSTATAGTHTGKTLELLAAKCVRNGYIRKEYNLTTLRAPNIDEEGVADSPISIDEIKEFINYYLCFKDNPVTLNKYEEKHSLIG
ncbi:hypothetical protein J4226_02970 [Candidatus Pacearchaeota archaeon]|nr:hypothetical protein [Candidatus Pacearchaeota archaeon]